MNYTLVKLQNEYKIIIPQIQRDYAQGRKDLNNKNKIKSYDFIIKIIEVLTTDKPVMNLYFIYGYTKKAEKDQLAFIPLDGQQRLTTLWLLHWYLSPKKEIEQSGLKMMSATDDVRIWLNKFTYETRNSSKRFCEKLIDEYLPYDEEIITAIKDANWFMTSWLNDPTVVSMLNMLDTIQNQCFDKEKAWTNLVENQKITFDYIDIKSDEFKLKDELYIKMNSRGKPLTLFENFKAYFSEILSAKNTDYENEKLAYEGTEITYQKYFAFKIDSVWTDLFWNFLMLKYKNENDNTNNDINKDISTCFMNYFTYIAQMCFFKVNIGKNVSDFKNDFEIFKKKENVIFLFKTLDLLHKISTSETNHIDIEKINIFFENIFQKDMINESYRGQVTLFEEKGVNLFEKCLLEGDGVRFEHQHRIIFYCLMSYLIKYNLQKSNEELRYYLRVVRNLLLAVRYRTETNYNSDIRINAFDNYWKIFKQLLETPNVYDRLLNVIDSKEILITEKALNNEKEKA